MGEIADGLINGDFDFFTGEYIGRGVGYPRTHNKSLPWEGNYKKSYTTSKDQAFKGIKHFLKNRLPTYSADTIVQEYMPGGTMSLKRKCLEIQKDFGAFVRWINTKYRTTS